MEVFSLRGTEDAGKDDQSVKELLKSGSDLNRSISDFQKASEGLPEELDMKFTQVSSLGNAAKEGIDKYDSALGAFKYGVSKFIALLIIENLSCFY